MSERTEESLKARVRETPLIERLNESRKRIAAMCSERRGPKMTIPVQHYDDDFFICTTLGDARDEVARLREALKDTQRVICGQHCHRRLDDTIQHISSCAGAQSALTPQEKGGENAFW